MQVLTHKFFRFMYFVCNFALILRLFGGLFGFEGEVRHGTDEVIKAEITLWGVGSFVYRCLRIWTSAACAWQLGSVAFAVVGKQGLGFLFSEELRALGKDGDGRCLVGFVCVKDLFREPTRLAEQVEMGQFCSLRRFLLVVTRIADGIGFLYAFVDDATVIGTVLLHSVDDALTF